MNINDFKSVLMLGVGGVSMHQIANALIDQGKTVFGYDLKKNVYIYDLQSRGMRFTTRFKKDFLHVDLCIITGAISNDNKYIRHLHHLNVKIINRAEALSMLCERFKCVIAVAGTHGKSTTASLIYDILRSSGRKVSCHIGADVFAPRFKLDDDYLVVEACEYKKSFLTLNPHITVVTNVEPDHMDSYGNMFNLRSAFTVFLRRGESRFVMRDKSTEFFKLNDINFVDIIDKKIITPKIKGEHNLKNISLALSVVKYLGVNEKFAIKIINKFEGVPRRYEYIGNCDNRKIYIDYAHHPTEIEAFTSTFVKDYKDAMIVFQPHTYSRTKLLLNEFVRVLSKINNLVIYKEYPARETKDKGMSAHELYLEIKRFNPDVKYSASVSNVFKQIENSTTIAFVGAGNINQVAQKIKNKKP